jgi:hypothetical protein
MATIAQFINNIGRRANAVLTNAPKATAKAAQAALDSLAANTPTLTTRARSNWVASIGSPDLSPRGFRSVAAVKAEGRSKLKALEADQEAHVANGGDKVPYLDQLNRGSSGQAPAGFVNGSILEAQEAIQNVTLLGK